MISGRATSSGTRRYAGRFPMAAPGHFRRLQGLTASSIGLGTYPGRDDETTDRQYAAAIDRALACGCNMLDTAVAYRHQRSERIVGRALADALARNVVSRDEIIIASKAGFLPFESGFPGGTWKYYEKTFINTGIVTAEAFVSSGHCIAPRFLQHQIETSRHNLDCETIDIYYLHNPETQLEEIGADRLYVRVAKAFEALERAVSDGSIGIYGVSTWSGFRVESGSRGHLSLIDLTRCARDAGGDAHHFRVIMVPLNLTMRESATVSNQQGPGHGAASPVLRVAQDLGLSVTIGSSLNGGRLARAPAAAVAPVRVDGFRTDAQRALHFVRSTPGVTTALVGMSNPTHVEENLELVLV
jgi:aryl-alcohol dehydrogenase-like predicted oxidoreductase